MKKRARHILSGILAVVICLVLGVQMLPTVYGAQSGESSVEAETQNSGLYFYNQLPEDAKIFYKAMQKMLSSGMFKTGTGSYDLTANGLSQESIEAHATGQKDLLKLYGAARDAFYADYPDVFYVDFSDLTLRITQNAGGYHAYLGAINSHTYYSEGFTSVSQVNDAIAAYEKEKAKLVQGARSVAAGEGENLQAKQIEYVHDAITKSVSYRLEDACKPENIGFIRTSYGALVKHEGVCEAYTRAFKSVMDELGIPCVMVQGVYNHSENVPELHIWNYVELDGKWYAVDVTMDDPKSDKPSNNGVDGYENHEYLLCGESVIGRKHVPSGIMSEAQFEFDYPVLELGNFGEEAARFENGLTVRYNKDGEFEGLPAGEYWVSYKGMGYAEAAKQGYYMVVRFKTLNAEGGWDTTDWGYMTPELYPVIEDSETEVFLPLPHAEYIEFGVTDLAPGNYLEDLDALYYKGDPFLLVADSGMLHNENGTYLAPPAIRKSSPSMTGRLTIGRSYHVELTYDDVLIKEGSAEPGIEMACYSNIGSNTGVKYSKLANFKWDGKSTVSFDFTPSTMWADDCVTYEFSLTGLIGAISKKAPMPASYYASNPPQVCTWRSRGYFWNLFAKPTLMENEDVDISDWTTADGKRVSEKLKSRIALVASTTSHAQHDTMNDMVEDKLGDEILSSQTYNINLTICNQQIVSTGSSVRISLGFPEGYGPDDAGVTFKAYHFKKDASGNIIGVEEIPCVVTPYGLVITCDSFSPFSVAAVKADPDAAVERTVVLGCGTGGTVESENGSLYNVKDGEKTVITVKAAEGYVIDTLKVCGEYADITDDSEIKITLSYGELAEGMNLIDARFVAKEIAEAEERSGETVVLAAEQHEHAAGSAVRENEKAATCTEDGSFDEVVYCEVCGAEMSRKTHTVDAAGHKYEDGKCVICGLEEPSSDNQGTSSAPTAAPDKEATEAPDSGNTGGSGNENLNGSTGNEIDDVPKTGDTEQLALLAVIMLASAAAGTAAFKKYRR